MTEITFSGQAPPDLPSFDLDELIARIEATLKPKPEIQPNAIYDRAEATAITGFSISTLLRAEEKGRLRSRCEGRRRYYFGRDLICWLAGDSSSEICKDSLSNLFRSTGTRCTTCANYRK